MMFMNQDYEIILLGQSSNSSADKNKFKWHLGEFAMFEGQLNDAQAEVVTKYVLENMA